VTIRIAQLKAGEPYQEISFESGRE